MKVSFSIFAVVLCGLLQLSIAAPVDSNENTETVPVDDTVAKESEESVNEIETPQESQNPSEGETDVETDAETDVEPETEAETEPATEAETELVTEAETEPVTEAETEPATEAQTEPVTEAQTEVPEETEKPVDTEAAKDVLNGIINDVHQLVEDLKNAVAKNKNAAITTDVESVSQKADKIVADAQSAIDEISKGNIDGTKDVLERASQNVDKLIEEAKQVLVKAAQNGKGHGKVDDIIQGGGNILHGAINALGSAAQKVVDTSNKINQGVHNLVGNAFDKVSGGAHKVVDTVTGILNWGKNKAQKASSSA